ncbi:hypothetical protein [Sciscionella marina]|uniref:hypothetical protein n=1 Tax=Sciscionella marina TaxID=508770 RepID=UPI00037B55B2|nr:hypothetical protein [Sciscionella marina]
MSYDELMQHAKDIQKKAVEKEGMDQAKVNAQATGGQGVPAPVDYDKIEQKYAYIPGLFEPFSRLPDPAGFEPLIDDLQKAMGDLATGATSNPLAKDVNFANPKLDKMTTAGGYLQGWTGDAAMAFKENFIDPFKTIANNQFTMVSTMKGALEAHQALWKKAREDIDKIAHTTKDALDNAGGCGKNEWSFGFSVLSAVGAVGGVLLTVATGGTGAAVAIPAIGALASVGSAGVAGITASGDSAEEITKSMKEAVDKLTQHIKDVESKEIAEKVQGILSAANGAKDQLVAKRPKLAGMDDGQLTGDGGMGRSD